MRIIRRIISFINRIFEKYNPIISKCNDDNIFAIAGQSAFFIILSAVPLSMFVISLMQNLNIPVEFIDEALSGIFTSSFVSQITGFLTNAYKDVVGISFVTLIVTLWSAAQGVHAITNGMNRVYDCYENRNWLFLRLRAMFYTVALFVVILILLGILVLGKSLNTFLSTYLNILPDFVSVLYNMRYFIIFLFLMILFALIYRNFPNISRKEHKEYGFKYQLPGAFLCTVSWFVLSLGISIYVDDFNGFSIYGSLTRLAVVMIWIYFCMVCVMICAEINYVYHDKIKHYHFRSAVRNLLRSKKSSHKRK